MILFSIPLWMKISCMEWCIRCMQGYDCWEFLNACRNVNDFLFMFYEASRFGMRVMHVCIWACWWLIELCLMNFLFWHENYGSVNGLLGFSENVPFRQEGSLLGGISCFGKKTVYEMKYGIGWKLLISAREFFFMKFPVSTGELWMKFFISTENMCMQWYMFQKILILAREFFYENW